MGKAKKSKKQTGKKKPVRRPVAKVTTIFIDHPARVTNPENWHPICDGSIHVGGSSSTTPKANMLKSLSAIVIRKDAPVPTTQAAIRRLGGVKGEVFKGRVMWQAADVPGAVPGYDNQLVVVARFAKGRIVQVRDFFGRSAERQTYSDPSLQIWCPQAGTDQYNCCQLNNGKLARSDGTRLGTQNLTKVWAVVVRRNQTPTFDEVAIAANEGQVFGYYMWQKCDVAGAQPGPDNKLVVYGKFGTYEMDEPVTREFYGCGP